MVDMNRQMELFEPKEIMETDAFGNILEPMPDPNAPEYQEIREELLRGTGKFIAENTPVVGEAILAKEISDDVAEGNYASAGLGTAALGVGLLPGGDILNKPIKAAAKKLRKKDVADAEELLGNTEKLEQWRKSNKLPESQRQKNIPEAEQAAEDLFQNKIKSKEARQRIKEVFPEPKLYTAETMPEMPTVTDVVGAMGKKSEKGILGVKGFDLEPGQRVGARLDIPAYNEYDKWVVSIHDGKTRNGSVVGYGQAIRLKNIEFGSDPKVALDIAKGKRVAKSTGEEKPMGKATIARVFGDYVPEDPYELHQFAKKVLADKDSGWTQVGMNPYRGSYFYDKATGTPVTRADEVIQVGPLVLAKNVTKPKMSELKEMFKPVARTAEGNLRVFNEGGAVPMKEQMEMFEDGGLKDEGGTQDPVSGNDVPVGSTQEEVRDDIPAQLSEGEFVLPADVVRYHGLDKIMRLRDEAKAGLARMEAMGQMGNSEEATIPDGVPFDINDLDIDDTLEYNQGGVVMQPGFTGIQNTQPSQFQNYQGQFVPYQPATVTPQAASQQFVAPSYTPPTQAVVPTMTQQQLPEFENFISTPTGAYDELREYRNPTTGEVRQIAFVGGEPIYPIPEGFVYQDPEAVTTEEVTTTPTTPQTTQVTQQQPDGDNDRVDTSTGTTMTLGGETYGPKMGGGIPGTIYSGPTQLTKGTPANPQMTFDLEFDTMAILGGATKKDILGEDNVVKMTPKTAAGVPTNVSINMPGLTYNSIRAKTTGPTQQQIVNVSKTLVDTYSNRPNENFNLDYKAAESLHNNEDNITGGKSLDDIEAKKAMQEVAFGLSQMNDEEIDRFNDYMSQTADKDASSKDEPSDDGPQMGANVGSKDFGPSGNSGSSSQKGSTSSVGVAGMSPSGSPFGLNKGGDVAKQMKKSGLTSKK